VSPEVLVVVEVLIQVLVLLEHQDKEILVEMVLSIILVAVAEAVAAVQVVPVEVQ
jgi:hypothetical protein